MIRPGTEPLEARGAGRSGEPPARNPQNGPAARGLRRLLVSATLSLLLAVAPGNLTAQDHLTAQEAPVEVLAGPSSPEPHATVEVLSGSMAPQEHGIRVVELFHPESGTRVRRVVAELTPVEIAAVRSALARRGYAVSDERGDLAEGTRAALERYQREHGLPVCGCPSYETIRQLGLRPRLIETVLAARPPSTEPALFHHGSDAEILYGSRRRERSDARPGFEPGRKEAPRASGEAGSAPPPRPVGMYPLLPAPPFGFHPPVSPSPPGKPAATGTEQGFRFRRAGPPGRRAPMPPIRPPIRSGGGS